MGLFMPAGTGATGDGSASFLTNHAFGARSVTLLKETAEQIISDASGAPPGTFGGEGALDG
jgi:hypothetical protein